VIDDPREVRLLFLFLFVTVLALYCVPDRFHRNFDGESDTIHCNGDTHSCFLSHFHLRRSAVVSEISSAVDFRPLTQIFLVFVLTLVEDPEPEDFETTAGVKVVPTFELMGLKPDLLRGIYAYSTQTLILRLCTIFQDFLPNICIQNFHAEAQGKFFVLDFSAVSSNLAAACSESSLSTNDLKSFSNNLHTDSHQISSIPPRSSSAPSFLSSLVAM
jgi:hypothetical protein